MHHRVALIFFSIISIAASASHEFPVNVSFNLDRFQGSNQGALSVLPTEVTVYTLNSFDPRTKLHMRRVSRGLRDAAGITCNKNIDLNIETEEVPYKSKNPFALFFMPKTTTTQFADEKTRIIDGLLANGMQVDARIKLKNISSRGFKLIDPRLRNQKRVHYSHYM